MRVAVAAGRPATLATELAAPRMETSASWFPVGRVEKSAAVIGDEQASLDVADRRRRHSDHRRR
jgi:hypothetical protein